ncbi:malto-oligosyltrehalose synthase [Flaviaesturariibacter terrae]
MYNPVSTYRIQFHKDFTLADFERHLDYFIGLGVGSIYASPIFTAVPGSTHGYDALNPLEINPEIGTLEDLRRISARLRAAGIGWLQDIVPNHMAYDTRNPWLRDVLEKGRHSVYANFFDVTWNDAVASGHIMAPFLGKSLEEAVRAGEITLGFAAGRLHLDYFGSRYPLRLRSYEAVLRSDGASDALRQWLQQAAELGSSEEAHQYETRFEELMQQLAGLAKNEAVHAGIERQLAAWNSNKDDLIGLANDQVYRLCHWQETDGRINYRRFFTVNGLICLNMQDEHVFSSFHELIRQLVTEGVFQGVRVDHVDGLYDPSAYLERLRALLGPDCYIVVEKILALDEELPQQWPIEGSTGYDFLAQVNQLLTDRDSEADFTRFYYSLVPDHRSVAQQVRDKKAHILYRHMGGELENLYQLLMQLLRPEEYAQMRSKDLKTAVAEFLLHLPVYRYYGNAHPLPDSERPLVHETFEGARTSRPDLAPALGLLEHTLLQEEPDSARAGAIAHLYRRLMQLSGPLMAKGVEDTLMYTFFRAIGNNEVGDTPTRFGWTTGELHRALKERRAEWPLALNATSTHDTKRGEDVRARLQALSALPGPWLDLVRRWRETNSEPAPDANDTYLLLQTLIGTAPFADEPGYGDRLEAYLEKALRESKRRSDWAQPDSDYEAAAKSLARKLAAPGSDFWTLASGLRQRVTEAGIVNSLAQLLLKCTAPGTPDIYQGCEGWDLSLVDPDNRRPVDYDRRRDWLETLAEGNESKGSELWAARTDGRVKFWLTLRLLQLRREDPRFFAEADYEPVALEGAFQRHVFAFLRRHGNRALLVLLPLHSAALAEDITDFDWKDTRLVLPTELGSGWKNLFVNKQVEAGRQLRVGDVLRGFPVAVLDGISLHRRTRGAGLLLHISSLPGRFAIGDLGPEAYRFADFLAKSRQACWQLLPINPTESGQGHSPYSSTSSHAGNRLLISPELLLAEGLLTAEDLHPYEVQTGDQVDFAAAETAKDKLLATAWARFRGRGDNAAFDAFCLAQKDWLDDFASYTLFKRESGGKPWYEWPEPWKRRDAAALASLDREALQQVRWEQFVFDQQWEALKRSCNERGIRLIGDLPFYVSYDSADVWAHRDIFRLDASGARLGLAGVPPDAFSDDGQLWGMPVFDWEKLRETGYAWWLRRLRRNCALFDLVRLDHFRAFAAYWEVPPGASTAREGEWKPGPAAHFFETIRLELGDLPFVAEDLGDIDDAVLDLRDSFGLPGMKVLQFAFGDDIATSPHIPHNYGRPFFAYSGTHDNNSSKGWFRQDIDDATRKRLQAYAGRSLTEDEVPEYLCRLALSSVAETAILPVQDVLGLDESARMNRPASTENNWTWRLLPGQLGKEVRRRLRQWTEWYGRG